MAQIQLFDCNGSSAQHWSWSSASESLVNPQSQRCLDDPSISTTDGTQLQLFDRNLTGAQPWTLPRRAALRDLQDAMTREAHAGQSEQPVEAQR